MSIALPSTNCFWDFLTWPTSYDQLSYCEYDRLTLQDEPPPYFSVAFNKTLRASEAGDLSKQTALFKSHLRFSTFKLWHLTIVGHFNSIIFKVPGQSYWISQPLMQLKRTSYIITYFACVEKFFWGRSDPIKMAFCLILFKKVANLFLAWKKSNRLINNV